MTSADILIISLASIIIWSIILYNIIKSAVKNGILEAEKVKDKQTITSPTATKISDNVTMTKKQRQLQFEYETGQIKLEEYQREWNKE